MRRLRDVSIEAMLAEPAGHKLNGRATTRTDAYAEPALYHGDPPQHGGDTALEFGRFSVLLRQRQLVADGVAIKLGTRAFDLLLVLLEADGSLVTKDEIFSRVWPGVVVVEENLKVQIAALRKALGEDCDLIRTEFGRGYRFTGTIGRTIASSAWQSPACPRHRSAQASALQWKTGWPAHPCVTRDRSGRRFALAR